MLEQKRKKAFIYLRQSSGDGDDFNESLQTQRKLCLDLAMQQKIEVLDIFIDSNISGKFYPAGKKYEKIAKLDEAFQNYFAGKRILFREAMGKLLERIQEVDYIIVKDSTRLHRSLDGSHQQKELEYVIRSNKVEIIEVLGMTIDLNNFDSRLVNLIRTQVNDEQIAKQKRASMAKRKEIKDSGIITNVKFFAGVYHGKKRFSFDTEKARAVKRIFEEIANYNSYTNICYIMNTEYKEMWTQKYFDCNNQNITKNEYLSLLADYKNYQKNNNNNIALECKKPIKIGAKLFYESSLQHISTQPIYTGLMYNSNRELIECKNAPPPIVSRELFFQVQKIIAQKKSCSSRIRRISPRFLPLSGFLKCGHCGAKLIVGANGDKIFYFCKRRQLEKNQYCKNSRIYANLSEELDYMGVMDSIKPLLLIGVLDEYNYIKDNQLKIEEIENINQKIDELKSKNKFAFNNFSNNLYSEEDFQDIILHNNQSIKSLFDKKTELSLNYDSALNNKIIEIEEQIQLFMASPIVISDAIYTNLLFKTIKDIIVYKDFIEIKSIWGKFSLDRLVVNKRLMTSPKYKIKYNRKKDIYIIHYLYTMKPYGRKKLVVKVKNIEIYKIY